MSHLALADVMAHLDDLPTLPAVVMDLLNSIDQEDIDVATLAKKVSYDQALTAKTLRMANSASHGLQVKVTTIQQAINYLGFQATRNLVMTAALTGCFPHGRCQGFDDKGFWRHSIAVACAARVLARHLRFNQDYAFTAGLLHDIGRLVLVTCFPAEYAAVLAHRKAADCFLLEAEHAVLGIDHVVAGMCLAEHWQFSETMISAIANHHGPDRQGAGFLAAIVHVANAIVHGLDLVHAEEELVPPVSGVAWTAMGLNEEAFLHIFRETELHYGEIAAVLLA